MNVKREKCILKICEMTKSIYLTLKYDKQLFSSNFIVH